jgi:hypothetical protein
MRAPPPIPAEGREITTSSGALAPGSDAGYSRLFAISAMRSTPLSIWSSPIAKESRT